jgi:hypothetical protein
MKTKIKPWHLVAIAIAASGLFILKKIWQNSSRNHDG